MGVVGVDGCSVARQGWSPGLAREGRRRRRGTDRSTVTVDRRPGASRRGWTVLCALADLRTRHDQAPVAKNLIWTHCRLGVSPSAPFEISWRPAGGKLQPRCAYLPPGWIGRMSGVLVREPVA